MKVPTAFKFFAAASVVAVFVSAIDAADDPKPNKENTAKVATVTTCPQFKYMTEGDVCHWYCERCPEEYLSRPYSCDDDVEGALCDEPNQWCDDLQATGDGKGAIKPTTTNRGKPARRRDFRPTTVGGAEIVGELFVQFESDEEGTVHVKIIFTHVPERTFSGKTFPEQIFVNAFEVKGSGAVDKKLKAKKIDENVYEVPFAGTQIEVITDGEK